MTTSYCINNTNKRQHKLRNSKKIARDLRAIYPKYRAHPKRSSSPHHKIQPDHQLIIPIQLYRALGRLSIFLRCIPRNSACRHLDGRGRLVERTIGIPFDGHDSRCLWTLHTVRQVDGLIYLEDIGWLGRGVRDGVNACVG